MLPPKRLTLHVTAGAAVGDGAPHGGRRGRVDAVNGGMGPSVVRPKGTLVTIPRRANRRPRSAAASAAGIVATALLASGLAVAAAPPAGAVPVDIVQTCSASNVVPLVGGNALINTAVAGQLSTAPFVLTLPTDVVATASVAPGGTIDYQVPLSIDLQAVATGVLATSVVPSIEAQAPGASATAYLEIGVSSFTTDIPVPTGTALSGTPTASSSPGGSPAVSASAINANSSVRGSMAGPIVTGAYKASPPPGALPARPPFTATVNFSANATTAAPGSIVNLRPGPAAFNLEFKVGVASGTLVGGATAAMSCVATNTIVASTQVTAAAVPSAPTGVIGFPGDATVTVNWNAAASNGSAITGYTVTASPGGATCGTTGELACVFGPLTNGQPFTFTVTATNGVGTSAPSAASAPVTPAVPARTRFTGITPKRIVDSRDGIGTPTGPFTSGSTRAVTVTGGTTTVPENATAVVLNMTATNNSAGTHLSVWPTGSPKPDASSLNLPANTTRPNLVTAVIGTGDQINIFNNSGTTHVIADVVGYFSADQAAGLYEPTVPERIFDTRDGTGTTTGPMTAAQTRTFIAAGGTSPAPANATAVVLNVTGANATQGTHLTLFPAGVAMPTASNLNIFQGVDSANLVMVKLGTGAGNAGRVSVFNNSGTTQVIADIVGYFTEPAPLPLAPLAIGDDEGEFTSLVPHRVIDSRPGGVGTTLTKWAAGETRTVTVTGGVTTVPAGVKAVVVNLTAVAPSSNTHLSVFPADAVTAPVASNLNLPAGDVRANLVVVGVDSQGRIKVFNNAGTIDVILDVVGYFIIGD